MKQIFISNEGRVVRDVPMPTIGDKEILVRVRTSVISTGTEMSSDRNKKSGFEQKKELLDKVLKMISEQGVAATYKRVKNQLSSGEKQILLSPIGYSNSGIVIAKGRLVDNFNVGDRVACCGAGVASHAEYVAVPINLAARLHDNVDYSIGAFTTIGSIAMQGLRRSGVSFGETIVITGLGLIGLLAVQIAKAWGLVVIGVDLNEERMNLAKKFGADMCLNASDPELVSKILNYTNGNGVDAAIIYAATLSSTPVNQAFDMCRKRGTVVAVGAVGMELDRNRMYAKELNFHISTSYGPGRYDSNYEENGNDYPIGFVRWTENRNLQEFIRLASIGKIDIAPLLCGTYNVVDAVNAFKALIENPQNIACAIEYPFNEIHDNEDMIHFLDKKAVVSSQKINVGVIGAGGFVKARHLKNMMKLKDKYQIIAICNHTPGSSEAEGENYGAKYVTTDYTKILSDPDINLIVIGTRHNLHGTIVEQAILAGKNVLVEKPLALTLEELSRIKEALNKHNVRIYVGFNRRYSPFVQKVKTIIGEHSAPIVVNYRVNAGSINKSSWVQSLEIGGGRLIGEGCHFIDLISYICEGDMVEGDIINLPISKDVQAEDNYIVSMKYSNGNIGVLTYTSIGGEKMPKEQLEIFCGGTSYVIDDFKCLKVFNKNKCNFTDLPEVDKGHYQLIEEIYKDLKGFDNILAPFNLDYISSEQSIRFVNIIRGLEK